MYETGVIASMILVHKVYKAVVCVDCLQKKTSFTDLGILTQLKLILR